MGVPREGQRGLAPAMIRAASPLVVPTAAHGRTKEGSGEEPGPVGVRRVTMQYVRAYRYIFDSLKWMTNVLLCAVCSLIPVIGPLILFGYMFELVEFMHRRKSDVGYPDFTFDRFSTYLMRGLWPFLV